jgi:AcrR family transcriptional regulator
MKSQAEPKADNRLARSQATRHALMRSAERLIAEKGLPNVSIRDILTDAKQRNTSALQYHFKNLQGLIEAIQTERAEETQARRAELMDEVLTRNPEPDLRQICALMVRPVFDLARSRIDFRRYVKAFGHELVLLEASALSTAARRGAGGSSGLQLGRLLRKALPHLDDAAYQQRMEYAIRLCASAMYLQARQSDGFRGTQADLFLNSLIDALVGLLGAPESDETRALRQPSKEE